MVVSWQLSEPPGPTRGRVTGMEAGEPRRVGSVGEGDPHFVQLVRDAASVAYSTEAGHAPHEVYIVLAAELRQRGIYPDPEAVLDAALLISRGKKPAVLRG